MTSRRMGLLGVLTLPLGLAASVLAEPPPSAAVTCVDVQGKANYAGLGYDHLVNLTNNCKKAVTCSVKTDVNPTASRVDLAPGERQSVVTWRGSPAYEFKPDVSCREK